MQPRPERRTSTPEAMHQMSSLGMTTTRRAEACGEDSTAKRLGSIRHERERLGMDLGCVYGQTGGLPRTDPVGGGDGSLRVLQGGSWDLGAQNARVAIRFGVGPGGPRRVLRGFVWRGLTLNGFTLLPLLSPLCGIVELGIKKIVKIVLPYEDELCEMEGNGQCSKIRGVGGSAPINMDSEVAMELELITVAFDPESGGFPQEPLCDVEGEVLSVIEHFFEHSGVPHLLLVVHHRPTRGNTDRRRKPVQQVHRPAQGMASTSARSECARRAARAGSRAVRPPAGLAQWTSPGRGSAYVLLHNRQPRTNRPHPPSGDDCPARDRRNRRGQAGPVWCRAPCNGCSSGAGAMP